MWQQSSWLPALLCVSFSVLSLSIELDAGVSLSGYTIEGMIKLDAVKSVRASDIKIILNGGQLVTFPRFNGYFTFKGVSAGTHLLEVIATGSTFPPLRVDVSARSNGQILATHAEDRRQMLADPLILTPVKDEYYFEKREPFSIWTLLKSPMGMGLAFMVVVLVVLPKLMDSIDPEELKKMQEEMRGAPAASVPAMLAQGRSK